MNSSFTIDGITYNDIENSDPPLYEMMLKYISRSIGLRLVYNGTITGISVIRDRPLLSQFLQYHPSSRTSNQMCEYSYNGVIIKDVDTVLTLNINEDDRISIVVKKK